MKQLSASIVVRVDQKKRTQALLHDVREGINSVPKQLPAKWLYDQRGGELFGRITQLPEYYLTRTESTILTSVTKELASIAPAATIVELGAGDSPKTAQLVAAGVEHGSLSRFMGFDIDPQSLQRGLEAISSNWPELLVDGAVADMVRDLDLIPSGQSVLVALLGSTIGNFLPDQRMQFYRAVKTQIQKGSWLLVGYDLVKDPVQIQAAYDDSEGVTAAFTGNVLRMMNRELLANFDERAFRHEAHWVGEGEYVRVGLRADSQQQVHVEALDLDVTFAPEELLHLEVCCKFRKETVEAELRAAGFELDAWWTDEQDWFALALARAC